MSNWMTWQQVQEGIEKYRYRPSFKCDLPVMRFERGLNLRDHIVVFILPMNNRFIVGLYIKDISTYFLVDGFNSYLDKKPLLMDSQVPANKVFKQLLIGNEIRALRCTFQRKTGHSGAAAIMAALELMRIYKLRSIDGLPQQGEMIKHLPGLYRQLVQFYHGQSESESMYPQRNNIATMFRSKCCGKSFVGNKGLLKLALHTRLTHTRRELLDNKK